jgi:hypothetical protein
MSMTVDQEHHLAHVKRWIIERIDPKYRKGQAEHGGDLWTKPTLPMMIEETTDFVVYIETLEQQLQEIHDDLQNALASKDWNAVAEALTKITGQLRPPVD